MEQHHLLKLSKFSEHFGETLIVGYFSYKKRRGLPNAYTESGTGVGIRQTSYTYETNGVRLETTTDPLVHITTNNYDTYGRLSSQIDYLNNTTSYTYDNLGRIAAETRPDGFVTTTAYIWGLSGGPTNSCYAVQQSGNDGSLSKIWYDELSRQIRSDLKSFDGSSIYAVTEYNNKGQLYRVSEPTASTSPSQWNIYTYDTYGRTDYIDRPSGRDTDYSYSGKRVTETTGGKARWKETNSRGLVTQANDQGGDILYSYYPDGRMKTITAPGNVVTSMQYDLAGNQTQLADPSAGTINYTYDAFGQMDTMINARSQTTTYNYYADGRPDTKFSSEGTTTYGYNATTKQLTGITSPGGVSRSYGYDTKGRVQTISETIPGSSSAFMTTFTYDSYGRLNIRTHPSGIVETLNYNANGYLASISAGGATRWTITAMNARQQITAATLGSALNATFGFDDYGYPTSSKATYNSVYKQDYRYSFNPVTGNLNSRQNYLRSLLESFTYDDLDRLHEVSGPQNLSMTYGLNGNISTKSDIGTTAFSYGEDAGPYALTGVTSSTLVIPTATQAASYTSFDQVSTIDEGIYHAAFIYSSDDQRAKMEVSQSGSTILTRWYGSSRYMKKTVGSTTKEYTWIGGDAYSAPAVVVKEGSTTTWYYLLRDYLGNVTHQVDASGNVIAEYNFDPWGRRRSADDWSYTLDANDKALFAGRGFTGHEHLTWFNLINMNGRLYDPLVGRFLSPDNYLQFPDFTQGLNRYSYCLNNPLIYIDPSGDFFWIFPHIGWSKKGGFSLGFSIGFGIPGVASVQVGAGYNFKSGEPYVFGGATFMFNTVYTSYSPSSGWNVGYTAGASLYSGFPISTNFATVGVNYNINSGSFSGNLSAWDIDRSGLSFDPSISAMIFPEQTTNFVRGQGFRTNDYVLSRFTGAGDYQGALDYFGFEGTYDPDLKSKSYQAENYWGATNTTTGEISYGKFAFENYATLMGTYIKESYTARNVLRRKFHELPEDIKGLGADTYLEEIYGYMHMYKKQGLFVGHKMPMSGVELYQSQLNLLDFHSYPTYPNRFKWIYKIPRKW